MYTYIHSKYNTNDVYTNLFVWKRCQIYSEIIIDILYDAYNNMSNLV